MIHDDGTAADVESHNLADEMVALGIGVFVVFACCEAENKTDDGERECGVRQPSFMISLLHILIHLSGPNPAFYAHEIGNRSQ